MTKVAVSGAAGRMGATVVNAVAMKIRRQYAMAR